MAETCRQVGERAAELGLARPSYVHVRRLISAERDRLDAQRERRHAIRAILTEVATDLTVGRRFDVYDVADRIQSARERS